MRRLLTVVAFSFGLGCVDYEPTMVPCSGVPTDNGNGTTTIACDDGTKDLVCTNPDCSGVPSFLAVEDTDLTRVILPTLATIDSIVVERNSALTSVSLPALTGARIAVVDNPALIFLSLPALTRCMPEEGAWGECRFRDNTSLKTLSLPSLVTGGFIVVTGNTALTALSLPSLGTGSPDVSDNPALTTLSFPSLTTSFSCGPECHGRTCGGCSFRDNTRLKSLSLPSLASACSLTIVANPALTSVDAPELTTIARSLTITGNNAYPQCRAEAVLSQLTSPPAYGSTISGNDPVCR